MSVTYLALAVTRMRVRLAFAAGFRLSSAETVRLYFDPAKPQIAFAAGDIKAALESKSYTVETNNLSALSSADSGKKIVLALTNDSSAIALCWPKGAVRSPVWARKPTPSAPPPPIRT